MCPLQVVGECVVKEDEEEEERSKRVKRQTSPVEEVKEVRFKGVIEITANLFHG